VIDEPLAAPAPATDFVLRPIEPSDGPAIDTLMRTEAQTTSMSITTHYHVDMYPGLLAQHPTLFGVAATAPGTDGLVGVATAFTDQVRIGGQTYPSGHLENLKVRHEFRRQGLGRRLAEWRIAEADRRFGGEGVIATGIEASNAASLATARSWSTQILGPVRVAIASTRAKPHPPGGVSIRPLEDRDVEAVVEGVNAFHEPFDLYPPQTAESLASQLATTPLGEPIRQYRVAVGAGGTVLAGALVTERFKLMADHVQQVPKPLELVNKVARLFPQDGVIRQVELALAWHAPNRSDAARALWEAIRYEWRDRATHVAAVTDPRGSLIEAFHVGFSLVPKIQLMIPVRSPVPLEPDRLVYYWR
jgi:GNAT superfamily N-acetyltransferase